ncbi:MAG: fibronectin type III domain-containing protein [Oscillospiraceae bacterium]|nr:fibronectin type III domain-containing protein [Oscillospiraceae bacterium]
MQNKYPELKKPLIGLAVSAAIFIGLVVYVAVLRQSNPRVPISEASVTVTSVTVNQSSVRIDWQCDNAGVTSYQIFRKENAQSNWKYYDSVSYHTKYYIDSNASNGNTYGYYVRAYDSRKTSSNSSYSPYIYIYIYIYI